MNIAKVTALWTCDTWKCRTNALTVGYRVALWMVNDIKGSLQDSGLMVSSRGTEWSIYNGRKLKKLLDTPHKRIIISWRKTPKRTVN